MTLPQINLPSSDGKKESPQAIKSPTDKAKNDLPTVADEKRDLPAPIEAPAINEKKDLTPAVEIAPTGEIKDFTPMLKKKHKKTLLKKILWTALRVGILLFVLGVVSGLVMIAWYSRDLPNPNKLLERSIAQSTKIYDNKGEAVLYEIYGDEKRTLVKLEEIPENMRWATIAAEDKYFYDMPGFNFVAMFKGVFWDPIIHGSPIRGGSGLTQQLVKNAILTDERSIERKMKELVLSYRIDDKFSKDEILQMYLNEIPYGSTAYGIEAAAQTYFGKDVKNLTLAEAAVLAGLPKAPTYYSPYGDNLDDLYKRQRYILDSMVEIEKITAEEAEAAKKEEIHFREKHESIQAPHFVMYVKDQLVNMFGAKLVEQGGLKVTTTLDMEKQKFAEEAVVKGVDDRGKSYGFSNAALIAMEPSSGKIVAMVGSKDYFDATIDGNVNVTLRARQPGSSIKPLIYAAAFRKGYTPDTILYDVFTKFKTDSKDYEPKNYSGKENGPVTMRKALQGSLNIPAVKTLYLVGVENALNFLESFGYSTLEDRSRFGLAIVLGGAEVKLIDHVAAYAVFPNEGVYHQPVSILKVEDSKGQVLFSYEDKKREVLEPNIARMMNNVLSDNNARAYIFSVNNSLTLPGRAVGAKTGTTNNFRDAWTVGYTPALVAGVWVGNNDNTEMRNGADGSVIAAPIWRNFMIKALEGTEVQKFADYTPIKTDKPVLSGQSSSEKTVKIDRISGKLATEYTPASLIEERVYKQAHSILYYVNKDDPQGPGPTNPAADPQYKNWEDAVQRWVAAKQASTDPKDQSEYLFINTPIPTLMDDVHLPENKPTILLNSPQNNETINSNVLVTSVNVTALRGVTRVEYYLDDLMIQTVYSYPYSLNYQFSSQFVNGYHKLKIVAYDDVDNSNQVEINLNLLMTQPKPQINWQLPTNGTVFSQSQFPITTTAKVNDLLSTNRVNFYYREKGGASFNSYGSIANPLMQNVSGILSLVPQLGEYELMAEIETKAGEKIASEVITIIVQ